MPDTRRKEVLDAFAAVLGAIGGITVFHGLDRDPVKADAPALVWMGGIPGPSGDGPGGADEDDYAMEIELAGIVTADTLTGLDDAASSLYAKAKAALDTGDAAQFGGAIERCSDVSASFPVEVLADASSSLIGVFPMRFRLEFSTPARTPYGS